MVIHSNKRNTELNICGILASSNVPDPENLKNDCGQGEIINMVIIFNNKVQILYIPSVL